MKKKFILIALACAVAGPALADLKKNENTSKKATTSTVATVTQKLNTVVQQKLSLNGQLNLGQVTAKVAGAQSADAAVTAVAIGNAMSSELDVALQQANLGAAM